MDLFWLPSLEPGYGVLSPAQMEQGQAGVQNTMRNGTENTVTGMRRAPGEK